MDAAHNPFAPGAGTQPPELAGREQNIERARITLQRIKDGRPERSTLLIGLRGVGKTVLLNHLHHMAEAAGYQAVLLESPEEKALAQLLAPPLRQILMKLDRFQGGKEKIRQAMSAIKSFAAGFKVNIGDIGVELGGPSGIADSGNLDQDLCDLLVSIGEAARSVGTAVGIFIDELQYVDKEELGALIAAIHRVGQLNLPVVIFGAGLPQLVGLTGKAKSYAERLFDFQTIGPLKEADAEIAIRGPIEKAGASIEPSALSAIISRTKGYPYFLQEWGSHAWNQAEGSCITCVDVSQATEKALTALDEGFFKVRFDRLTKSEKDYLRAMAELGSGPHRSGDIAKKLKRPVSQLAPTRANIIAKGMAFAPAYGDNDFTVPMFDEYLHRVMPEFSPKRPGKRTI